MVAGLVHQTTNDIVSLQRGGDRQTMLGVLIHRDEDVGVHPGGVVDGKEIVMEVKVGDKVILSKYAGTEVKLDGQEYTILRQSEILSKLD